MMSSLFPKQQILDSSKLKVFADDNFKFDENSREFSKRVQNTVGKGENARYEQFLHFPQCFQKICNKKMQKQGLVWERVNPFHTIPNIMMLRGKLRSLKQFGNRTKCW